MYTLLLVEDDFRLLSAMSRTLSHAGFNVIEASDGRQAMDLLKDHTVDLTVIDIFMPEVDGMEFTIRVKRLVPEAKIVAMSGGGALDKESVLDIARRYGAARTLTKPFEMTELIEVVNEVLEITPADPEPKADAEAGH